MANGHGGKRAKSGRKSTKHEYVDDGLISPLEFMLNFMRDEKHPMAQRLDVAKASAPYCHARLQSTTVQADIEISPFLWDK